MSVPKHLYNQQISYCLKTPSFTFEVLFAKSTLRLTLKDQKTSKSFHSVFSQKMLKNQNYGRGIYDPLDLLLIFLPASQANYLFGEQNFEGQNVKNKLTQEIQMQYNEKIKNGKNWFCISQNGVIQIGTQFIQEGNVKRLFKHQFCILLGSTSQQMFQKQIPQEKQIPAITTLRQQFEVKMSIMKRELEESWGKKLQQTIHTLEKKIQQKMVKKQISYSEAKKKYIDDLCD